MLKKTANIPNIPIPFWLFCVLIASVPAYLVAKHYSNKPKDIANQSFGVDRIVIDGKHFPNCDFDGTELVFTGRESFGFSSNRMKGIRIKFKGSADLTVDALIAMNSDNGINSLRIL